jgi:hypothetical protein
MKKVVSPSEVAHLFANQHQTEAYNQGRSLYFHGKSIYSYGSHFCIARHVENEAGERALLFTTRDYSNTTAKHISIVHAATSHKNRIYCSNPTGTHEENFKAWTTEAEGDIKKLQNARKPEIYIGYLQGIANKAQRYADYFGLAIPPTLAAALEVTTKAETLQYMERKAEAIKEEEKRKAKEKAAKHLKELKDFRAGKVSRLYNRAGLDYLRKDAEGFTTSQGVKIPLAVGLRLYNNLDNMKPGDAFLSYEVRHIDNKMLVVGCHQITRKEIDKVVNQ